MGARAAFYHAEKRRQAITPGIGGINHRGADLATQVHQNHQVAVNHEHALLKLNLKRRHLTEGQRAAVAAKLANMPEGAPVGNRNAAKNNCLNSTAEGITQSEAAKMLSVSRYSVSVAARAIKDAIPEVVQALENGQIGADRAAH